MSAAQRSATSGRRGRRRDGACRPASPRMRSSSPMEVCSRPAYRRSAGPRRFRRRGRPPDCVGGAVVICLLAVVESRSLLRSARGWSGRMRNPGGPGRRAQSCPGPPARYASQPSRGRVGVSPRTLSSCTAQVPSGSAMPRNVASSLVGERLQLAALGSSGQRLPPAPRPRRHRSGITRIDPGATSRRLRRARPNPSSGRNRSSRNPDGRWLSLRCSPGSAMGEPRGPGCVWAVSGRLPSRC